ncbi:uncharacterized protein LOC132633939 [Lycium barbarum]|uniref:uncharacterized protein LOC132633939 n=1 Tax=Lycium barbarum TaxID=112863 RepID=UPI00293F5F22|nr:uncharacterized protein LOC132633939 [Lycium barbarum]
MGTNAPTNGSTTATYIPNSSSPLYLATSNVPGISVVPVPFCGTGFGGWRRNMVVALSVMNKIALVDGSCTKPSDDSPQLRQWSMVNHLVMSWITHSLTPEIAESVQYSETAQNIWSQLNKRYGTVSGTRIFELKKEIASTSQGCLDIAFYFNKFKKIWDKLSFMRTKNANRCTYAAKEALIQEEEENHGT